MKIKLVIIIFSVLCSLNNLNAEPLLQAKIDKLAAKAKAIPYSDFQANYDAYDRLVKLDGNNHIWIKKRKKYAILLEKENKQSTVFFCDKDYEGKPDLPVLVKVLSNGKAIYIKNFDELKYKPLNSKYFEGFDLNRGMLIGSIPANTSTNCSSENIPDLSNKQIRKKYNLKWLRYSNDKAFKIKGMEAFVGKYMDEYPIACNSVSYVDVREKPYQIMCISSLGVIRTDDFKKSDVRKKRTNKPLTQKEQLRQQALKPNRNNSVNKYGAEGKGTNYQRACANLVVSHLKGITVYYVQRKSGFLSGNKYLVYYRNDRGRYKESYATNVFNTRRCKVSRGNVTLLGAFDKW